jgi:hypothetical protein
MLPSTQLANVMSSIWQHILTSECHIQATGVKYIKDLCTVALGFELRYQFYSLVKYMFLRQISYIQQMVERLKRFNDC